MFLHIFRKYFFAIPCRVKCPYFAACFPKFPPFRISESSNLPQAVRERQFGAYSSGQSRYRDFA